VGGQPEDIRGRVGEADQPQGGINRKAAKFNARLSNLALQQAVAEADGKNQVAHRMGESAADILGHHCRVSLGSGIERPEIEAVVEKKKLAVNRFQWIVNHWFNQEGVFLCHPFPIQGKSLLVGSRHGTGGNQPAGHGQQHCTRNNPSQP